MLITDYTLNWTTYNQVEITWDGGVSTKYYTVYINGIMAYQFSDSDEITKTVTMRQDQNNDIVLIQHDALSDNVDLPGDTRLLLPTVQWLFVDNAAEYWIYQVVSEREYILHVELIGESPRIYSWAVPFAISQDDLDMFSVRVYAKGSWGLSEIPSKIVGLVAGYPPCVKTVDVSNSSDGLVLVLSS